MDAPLLSIVIPVYNARRYLPLLIESFRSQRNTDFELVFVDDGSTDGSFDELCRLTEAIPISVTLHQQENCGVSAARNIGVSLAKGHFLSFVDSDDAVHPEYVATLAQWADADILLFRSLRRREGDTLASRVWEETVASLSPTEMLTRFAADPTAFSMCNLFIRRSFYLENRLSFRVGYRYYEDYELFCRAVSLAERIAFTERDLYFYIQRATSVMTRFTVDRLSCMTLMEELVPHLQKRVPDFVPIYRRALLPRLYWSLMWQASLAFSLRDACRFAHVSQMRKRLRCLYSHPDWRVRLSSRLFGVSPPVFVALVKLLKQRGSHLEKAEISPFLAYFSKQKNGQP